MSKKPKFTDWYPAGTTPARIGVYEVPSIRAYIPTLYQHWNGTTWGGWAATVIDAKNNANYVSSNQAPQWRGLAEKP
jgi:hypothetical protein